jgi:hypothetical protein
MAIKEIVTVRLGVDLVTGKFDLTAPLMVRSSRGIQLYTDEPHVIEQFRPDDVIARFEAEWDEATATWKFGKRVADC